MQRAPLRGPLLQPQILGIEPSIAQPDALARPAAMGKNHTIVISTLAIVLAAIIVTILVVK